MTLIDKLESLDTLILAQYEKVNQYCYKRFGTDKYDLANVSAAFAGALMSGTGVYVSIREYLAGKMADAVASNVITGMGLLYYEFFRYQNNRLRDLEFIELSKRDVTFAPTIGLHRPIVLLFTGLLLTGNLYSKISGSDTTIPWEFRSLGEENYQRLNELILHAVSGTFFSLVPIDYFRSCTLFPPQESKRKLGERLKNYVTGIFRPSPQVQPQENQYSGLELNLLQHSSGDIK